MPRGRKFYPLPDVVQVGLQMELEARTSDRRRRARPAEDRFWEKVEIGPYPELIPPHTRCFVWTAGCNTAGYGLFTINGRMRLAHVLAYEWVVGPIPSGYELDHRCRNPPCVNPTHLEPVTHTENMRRGHWARKTHCPHGHEYTPENIYSPPGTTKRFCRACKRKPKKYGKVTIETLSVADAAAFFGAKHADVRYWADSGMLRHYRTTGGHRRFSIEQLEAFKQTIDYTRLRRQKDFRSGR